LTVDKFTINTQGLCKNAQLDDFRIFGAVADTGSFSQAAKQLNVNHSTVSRRIQAMEQSHGVRLFDRTQTGYQLTEAGTAIYDIVLNLQENTHKASRILQGHDARLEGTINITMPNDLFMFLLAEPLKEFHQQHPEIVLNLMVSKGLRNMANREADLAVRVTSQPPEYLIGSKISSLQHGLYVKRNYAKQATTPIIVWGSEAQMPDWAIEHFPNPKIVLRVDDLYAMHQAVKAGFGIARMPCFVVDIVQDPEIEHINIYVERSSWAVWLLHHEDLRNSAKINQCRAFLKSALLEKVHLFTGEKTDVF